MWKLFLITGAQRWHMSLVILSRMERMYQNPRGGCYIVFTSSEQEQIKLVTQIMQVKNHIEIYQPKRGKSKLRYTLQIGSKRIYLKLLSLGFVPTRAYSLAYSGQDVVKLYSFLYPASSVPCLKRKKRMMEEGLKVLGP